MKQLKKAAGLLQQIGAEDSPDTILAHITPKEAAMLKARGGSGRRDPNTGLLHFEDDSGDNGSSGSSSFSLSNPSYNYTPTYGESNTDSMGNYGDSAYGGYQQALTDADGHRGGYADTLGGRIVNAFGGDPFGTGADFLNGGLTVAGAAFPAIGAINKVSNFALNAGREDMPSSSFGSKLASSFLQSSLFNSASSPASAPVAAPEAQALNNLTGPTYASTIRSGSGSGSRQPTEAELLMMRRGLLSPVA